MAPPRHLEFGLRSLAAAIVAGLIGPELVAQDDVYLADVELVERYVNQGKLVRADAILEELVLDLRDAPSDERPSPAVEGRIWAVQLQLHLMRGDYDATRKALGALGQGLRSARPIRLFACELYEETGRYDDAIREYAALVEADKNDVHARCAIGLLQRETGARQAAATSFEEVVAIGERISARAPEQLTWVARALIALGERQQLRRAADLLIEAVRVDADYWPARLTLGRLYYQAYGDSAEHVDPQATLKTALERNGDVEEILLELFRQRRENYSRRYDETQSYLDRALARNPKSVPALTQIGVRQIGDRQFEAAVETLDKALAINPRSKSALAQRAAVARLLGDEAGDEAFRTRIRSIDPLDAVADREFGARLIRLYRFEDAQAPYKRVLADSPKDVAAMEGLARAMIYSGQAEEAAALLVEARKLEPGFNDPWRHNQLAVQDMLRQEYTELKAGTVELPVDGFRLFLHRDDVSVLAPYLVPLQQEARTVLGRKYGWFPAEDVRIEVLHTWDDFSVRTTGFRGFTALGACFGPFVTMVSPRDTDVRRNGFPWTATAWHEYTHVLTLGLSAARIPRWWTEGFSVFEEKVLDDANDRGMTRELFDAWNNGTLPPVLEFNNLFRTPPQVLFGYFLSGEVVKMLADEFGFAKLVATLPLYAQDLSTEEVFQKALGLSTAQIDRRFRLRVEKQVAGLKLTPRWQKEGLNNLLRRLARNPDDVEARLQVAWAYIQQQNTIDAGVQLRRVAETAPDHKMLALARARLRTLDGDEDSAVAFYAGALGGGDPVDFDAHVEYARILERRGDRAAALRQYQAADRAWPDCTEPGSAPLLNMSRLERELGNTKDANRLLERFVSLSSRAFDPRIELAGIARQRGDNSRELELLEQANRIDPFSRSLHVRLAGCYEEAGRSNEAVRELRVALAVRTALDREVALSNGDKPSENDPAQRRARAGIALRLAKLLLSFGSNRADEARRALERAVTEDPGGPAGREAKQLLGQ